MNITHMHNQSTQINMYVKFDISITNISGPICIHVMNIKMQEQIWVPNV